VNTVSSPRPQLKAPDRASLAKRQRQLASNDNGVSKELTNHHPEKALKPPSKKPIKQATKYKYQHKLADEIESTHLLKLKSNSKLPASNKFTKIKLSTTELENNHRGYDAPRRSSLASTEKLLIKDRASDDDDDDEDDDNSYNDGDDTTDEVFTSNEKPHTKSTMTLRARHETMRAQTRRSNTSKLCQANNHGIRKRNNCSLSSTRNLALRSSLSTSNSSSRLELDWQQQVSVEFKRTTTGEVFI